MYNPFVPRPVPTYWWNQIPNFGDGLAPHLLERFAYIKPCWSTISHATIATVGSILEHIPPLWDGYILGSGRLHEVSRTQIVQMKSGVTAKILALRGPLSARGIPGNYALGDPGLLANELVGPQEPKWDLGIIPHWQDDTLVARFRKLIPSQYSVHVIHPSADPLTVVREIGSCRRVVSSSLHGIIVADSFGIPRRVESCDKMLKDGGTFKFQDYSAAIKMEFKTGIMQEPERNRVDDVKFAIYDAYRELGRLLNK